MPLKAAYCYCKHFDNKVVVRTDNYSYAASGILHGILHYCGQTAGWMKTPLGTEVDLGAGHGTLYWTGSQCSSKEAQHPLF